jgi:molecular chaperone GrpE
MSDASPPPLAGNAVGDGQEALTSEQIEAVLADFRAWLQQAATTVAPSPTPPVEPVDLHTLVGQFVALRHEVNLQTRAARAQQELGTQSLAQLSAALEALQQSQTAMQQAGQQGLDEALRPILKALLDARDALSLAAREVQRVRETILPALQPSAEPQPVARPVQSFWARFFGGHGTSADRVSAPSPPEQQAMDRVRQLLESVLTGYTMSLQRLERTLQQCGLEPIACVGQSFDPEEMEVVAAIPESGRPAGEVLDEIRRGYRWRGRVFRYAQVSVAQKSNP